VSWEESKVVSFHPFMFRIRRLVGQISARRIARELIFVGVVVALCAGPALYGQSFTLTSTTLTPLAVDPGGTATAPVNLAVTGSVGSISLTCTVSSNNSSVSTSDYPGCLISPNSATSNAILSLTVTAGSDTPAGEYSVTVTGTAGSETQTLPSPLYLNVVDVQQDYTLTITKTISPGTVSPGGGAEATVTVTPIASYTGTVTLSCLSVTPSQVAGPYCSFNPPSVTVNSSTGSTSVLTVSTYGTQQTVGELEFPRMLRAFWLGIPALALVGVGGGSFRGKRPLGLFLLLAVAGGILFLPSCGGKTTTSNNTIGYVTPKDTYTFTLTGVDQNGVAPSNSTSDQATVSLTVN
jgi:hypothetical protein